MLLSDYSYPLDIIHAGFYFLLKMMETKFIRRSRWFNVNEHCEVKWLHKQLMQGKHRSVLIGSIWCFYVHFFSSDFRWKIVLILQCFIFSIRQIKWIYSKFLKLQENTFKWNLDEDFAKSAFFTFFESNL